MKSIQITDDELEMIRKALRWAICDLRHSVKICSDAGEQPPVLLRELVKLKALEKKFETKR